MFILKIKLKGTFIEVGKLIEKTTNHNDFCYQCSKDGPDHLLGNSRIRDKKMKHPPLQKKSISCEYKMKKTFKKNNRRKKGS